MLSNSKQQIYNAQTLMSKMASGLEFNWQLTVQANPYIFHLYCSVTYMQDEMVVNGKQQLNVHLVVVLLKQAGLLWPCDIKNISSEMVGV